MQNAQDMLNLWLEAEKAVATGQEYQIGSHTLKRADLSEIRKSIIFWQGQIDKLSRTGRNRVYSGMPVDF